ncbi:hypothetical protein, partial [Vibrio crassostreae]
MRKLTMIASAIAMATAFTGQAMANPLHTPNLAGNHGKHLGQLKHTPTSDNEVSVDHPTALVAPQKTPEGTLTPVAYPQRLIAPPVSGNEVPVAHPTALVAPQKTPEGTLTPVAHP